MLTDIPSATCNQKPAWFLETLTPHQGRLPMEQRLAWLVAVTSEHSMAQRTTDRFVFSSNES